MQPITRITIAGIRLGIVLVAFYWVCIAVGTHLPARLDVSPSVNDKIKHFTAFAGLAFGLCYVTGTRPQVTTVSTAMRFAIIAAVVLLYAVIDEITQIFIPGRVPDRYDVLADAMGAGSMILVYASVRRLWKRRRARHRGGRTIDFSVTKLKNWTPAVRKSGSRSSKKTVPAGG